MVTSKNTRRLSQNPLEAAFLKTWNDPRFDLTLDYIASDRPNECGVVSDRDREIAATVIQWLGSPVGQCFLEEATGIEIRKQLPKELLYLIDDASGDMGSSTGSWGD